MAVAAVSLLSPAGPLAGQILALHTLQHMLLLAVAAPLVVYGLGPWLARGPWTAGRVLGHPVTGLIAFNAALFTWQVPALVELAARNGAVHQAAHASLLGAALCFWWPILRPAAARGALSPIAKIGYLLVAGVPPTIPGVVLAFSHRVYYASATGGARLLGLSALEDQQLAGLLLFGVAKFALLTGTFIILWRLLGPSTEPPDDDRDEVRASTGPPAAPAWLQRLDEDLPEELAPERQRVGSA